MHPGMVLSYNILALAAFWGFAQATPTPQTHPSESQAAASPVVSGGLYLEPDRLTPAVMLWYNTTNRDDFALYPSGKRDGGGWQELSAAANSLMSLYPDFIPQAVFGAGPGNFLPRNSDSSDLRSSFQDHVAFKNVALSISSTSPAIRVENKVNETTGPWVEAFLSLTLFPLSKTPMPKNVTFAVSESNFGNSAVAWPLALMAAYMDDDVQKLLKGKGWAIHPTWDQELYGDADRISSELQTTRVAAAKAALYLLTGLDPVDQFVTKRPDLQLHKLAPDNEALLTNTNPQKKYNILGPNLVSTIDGGIRSLYHNDKDWFLLDCRAKLFPDDAKVVHNEIRPANETDNQAFDRLLYYETPVNAISFTPSDVTRLESIQKKDSTEMSKLVQHPENFLSAKDAALVRRRMDSVTGPHVSRRTARP